MVLPSSDMYTGADMHACVSYTPAQVADNARARARIQALMQSRDFRSPECVATR